MSLERIKGDVVFTCDGCDDTLEPGTDDFAEAREELKREGWRTYKDGDDWQHKCPACNRESDRSRWWDK